MHYLRGEGGINFAMLCCRIAPLVFPLTSPVGPLQRTALRKKLINQLILFSRRALCKQVCNDPTKKQKVSNPRHLFALFVLCGEGGIRTPGTVARTPHFECGPIDHSGTSPFVFGVQIYE